MSTISSTPAKKCGEITPTVHTLHGGREGSTVLIVALGQNIPEKTVPGRNMATRIMHPATTQWEGVRTTKGGITEMQVWLQSRIKLN